jgi:hypothetical protein
MQANKHSNSLLDINEQCESERLLLTSTDPTLL